MIFGKAGFGGAVADFEAAVTAQDAKRSGKAFVRLQETFGQAREAELLDGGPRLAAVLEQVPPGPRAVVAVLVGACVERGADAERCAPGVLAGLRWALEQALVFSDAWVAAGGGAFPVPDGGEPGPESVERAGFDAAVGWWTLPQWEMAAVAMLNHPGVRRTVAFRGEALRLLGAVERASGTELKSLAYALLVLDDEPLVALHRASGTGYLLRLSGIGDNFQLHTLLADALIGGGHVEGHAPSPQEVAVCRETPGQVETVGSFDLVAPDGEVIWNEGAPADIPVVDGVRLLVLDEPSYRRSWPAGRFFPGMRGDALLERPLDPEEAERWYAHVSPAKDATG
ncbi:MULTISPECIES: hypothetical protein [Streptomyces]|uniref:Uncharacterized protein n=2 Tax=Streptomyces TaxID=1883 RepID=A0A6G3SM88_STRAQ|nr:MULTISPECIES: hypothetical protein [Streptomyces]NEB84126.1 hypothetical protein [Streptomyces anulatus]OWA20165.1 hypothetical protein B9W61_27035 [Streptomyces sp. CS057]